MSLTEVSQISQTLGSVAVVASLLFVGFQIRQNTKATRAASHHAVSEALNRLNILWARNGEITRIWLSGLSDRSGLTPEERWRFDSMVRAYLHVCETMYTQADLGAGDFGIVTAEENGIKTVFSSESVREWWVENPFGFSSAFRDYVGKLIKPNGAEAGLQAYPGRNITAMTSGGLEHCAKPWQVVEPPLGETFGSQFAVRICYRVGKAKHSGREAMTLGSV